MGRADGYPALVLLITTHMSRLYRLVFMKVKLLWKKATSMCKWVKSEGSAHGFCKGSIRVFV